MTINTRFCHLSQMHHPALATTQHRSPKRPHPLERHPHPLGQMPTPTKLDAAALMALMAHRCPVLPPHIGVVERRALAQFFLIFWLFSRGNTSPRTRRSPKRRTRCCRPDGACHPDGALPPCLAAHAGASLGLCCPSRVPLFSIRAAHPFHMQIGRAHV